MKLLLDILFVILVGGFCLQALCIGIALLIMSFKKSKIVYGGRNIKEY